jgi:predicted nucleic acid-binding Zn ribbon protein
MIRHEKDKREAKQMKDAINDFLKASGLDEEYRVKTILGKWEQLVGKPIAQRTEKLYIQNKVLFIAMNSSVMREELQHQKSRIIEIINKEANTQLITDVFLM